MRRVQHQRRHDVDGLLHAGPQYASGGFIADSKLDGRVAQRLAAAVPACATATSARWSNGVWNQVFAGVEGAPAQSYYPRTARRYTTLPTTPVSREKPYLYVDATGSYSVFVPSLQRELGRARPGRPGTTPGTLAAARRASSSPSRRTRSQAINNALATGKNLLLTPGVYDVDQTIKVKRADTVVLGLGIATLTRGRTASSPLTVGDVPGVDIAGVIDRRRPGQLAGAAAVGSAPEHGSNARRHQTTRPTRRRCRTCSSASAARTSARPTVEPRGQQRQRRSSTTSGPGGPTTATASAGRSTRPTPASIVNGDNVTATGLFVEHYQKYNVIWNGENGTDDLLPERDAVRPAEPGRLAARRRSSATPAYKVADSVKTHEALGRRQLHLLQRRPDDPRDPRLRGARSPRA